MVYPKGLPDTVAPLVVTPRSHLRTVGRGAPRALMAEDLPGEPEEVTSVEPLVVVLDSALWHMRPAVPVLAPRFDLNVSYGTLADCWGERRRYSTVLQLSAAQSTLPDWFRTS